MLIPQLLTTNSSITSWNCTWSSKFLTNWLLKSKCSNSSELVCSCLDETRLFKYKIKTSWPLGTWGCFKLSLWNSSWLWKNPLSKWSKRLGCSANFGKAYSSLSSGTFRVKMGICPWQGLSTRVYSSSPSATSPLGIWMPTRNRKPMIGSIHEPNNWSTRWRISSNSSRLVCPNLQSVALTLG